MSADKGDMEAANEEAGGQEQVALMALGPVQHFHERLVDVQLLYAMQLCAGTPRQTKCHQRHDSRDRCQSVECALPAKIGKQELRQRRQHEHPR